MTPSLLIRPVLACLAAATLSACGMVDADPHRFENMAEAVAAIPLDEPREAAPVDAVAARTAAEAGLRPALKVEVMDPHALWDARDGGDPTRALLRRQIAEAAVAGVPEGVRIQHLDLERRAQAGVGRSANDPGLVRRGLRLPVERDGGNGLAEVLEPVRIGVDHAAGGHGAGGQTDQHWTNEETGRHKRETGTPRFEVRFTSTLKAKG